MSYHTFKSDTAKIVSDVLAGIACLLAGIIVILAVFGTPLYISSKNNDKVQHMTDLCIQKGYDGWADDDGNSQANLPARSYCYNEGDKN